MKEQQFQYRSRYKTCAKAIIVFGLLASTQAIHVTQSETEKSQTNFTMENNLIVNTNSTVDGKKSIGEFFNDIGQALMTQNGQNNAKIVVQQPNQQQQSAQQPQKLQQQKTKNETEPAANSTMKVGAGAGVKKEEVHAVSETGQNITVQVHKSVEEIHEEKDHVHGKMEEYLKKNPKKHDGGKQQHPKQEHKEECKEQVKQDSHQQEQQMKKYMNDKIKQSIEKKKEAPSKEQHYKEYTHQPAPHDDAYSKEDFDKVHNILNSMKQKNMSIKKQSTNSNVGGPTKKAEVHAKILDEALRENDYFVDHPKMEKEMASGSGGSAGGSTGGSTGGGLGGIVDEIAGECEKLAKNTMGTQEPAPAAPVTPYIPPEIESTPAAIPEPTVSTPSVPESAPAEIPTPAVEFQPAPVPEAAPAPAIELSPAPAQAAASEPEPTSDLAKELETFDSSKITGDTQESLAQKSIKNTIIAKKTESNQLTKLLGEIDDEPHSVAPAQVVDTQTEEIQTQQTEEVALIPEFQDHASTDNDDTINHLADKIKFHDNEITGTAESLVQTDESSNSHGPEEDNLLQLGNQASSQVSSQAAMQAKIAALLQSRVQAKTQAKTKAQSKVKAQDANLIAMLQKQIATMEAKKNPQVQAAAAKKKAVHNIQKSLTAKILNRLDDNQPLVNVFSKMQSLSKMMPAVQDMERRLGILHQVEPIIEKAVKTLESVIDLKNSPLQPAAPKAPAPAPAIPDTDLSLDSLTEVAAAPAAGGDAMASLLAQLGGGGAAAAAPAEPEPEAAGGMDLSALLGGLGGGGGLAAPAAEPADDAESVGGAEKDMLAKLLGGM